MIDLILIDSEDEGNERDNAFDEEMESEPEFLTLVIVPSSPQPSPSPSQGQKLSRRQQRSISFALI